MTSLTPHWALSTRALLALGDRLDEAAGPVLMCGLGLADRPLAHAYVRRGLAVFLGTIEVDRSVVLTALGRMLLALGQTETTHEALATTARIALLGRIIDRPGIRHDDLAAGFRQDTVQHAVTRFARADLVRVRSDARTACYTATVSGERLHAVPLTPAGTR